MRRVGRLDVEEHNRAQIRYFESAGKEAMKPSASPYVDRQVDELVRFAGLQKGERVLDLGCGMGRYTFPLAERGLKVEGLDLSQALLDRLDAFNGGRYEIPLHCADILDAPPGLEAAFDGVVGFFTLHHLHDLPSSFRAMARLVRPGGRIVFLEPNPLNVLYYVQLVVSPGMSWQGDKGILKMRPKRVFAAMAGAGLGEFSMARFGFFPPVLANQPWGPRLERVLEEVRAWRPLLPFQLFRGDRIRSS
jgi:SAM-dependent methyltransferase